MSYLVSQCLNLLEAKALQLKAIRNRLLVNTVNLVDCSKERNSTPHRARRHLGKGY